MNKKIQEISKAILKHRQRVLRDPEIMHPQREWSIGLLIAGALFAVVTIWSAGVYLANRDVASQSANTATEAVVYRESVVSQALEIIAKKEAVRREVIPEHTAVPKEEPVVAATSSASTTQVLEDSSSDESSTSSAHTVPIVSNL